MVPRAPDSIVGTVPYAKGVGAGETSGVDSVVNTEELPDTRTV